MNFKITYLDGKSENIQGDSYEKQEWWFLIHSGGSYGIDDYLISGYNVRNIEVTQ